jgi:putative membrane protein
VLIAATACPATGLAHAGLPPAPHDLWAAWTWDPATLLALGLTAGAYVHGLHTYWRRVGVGRGIHRWQAAAFATGLVALFAALISPLDALGTALFSAHMVQHLVLVLVAAPLLVLGAPLVPFLWALPRSTRHALAAWWPRATPLRAAWRTISHPVAAWVLHTAALWIWHLPALYQAALQSAQVHAAEHASFLATALLFWWALGYPGRRGRLNPGAGVLYVFAMGLQSSLLGALIAFAPTPWYPAYAVTTQPWGLTPLEDQQLAGLIMWVPAGLIYVLAALILFGAWLSTAGRGSLRPEGRPQPPSHTD